MFSQPLKIGEPLDIISIYKELNKVRGVSDTKIVRIKKKVGDNYADIKFDIDANTTADGRYIMVPKNAVIEVKFPSVDLKGAIV